MEEGRTLLCKLDGPYLYARKQLVAQTTAVRGTKEASIKTSREKQCKKPMPAAVLTSMMWSGYHMS